MLFLRLVPIHCFSYTVNHVFMYIFTYKIYIYNLFFEKPTQGWLIWISIIESATKTKRWNDFVKSIWICCCFATPWWGCFHWTQLGTASNNQSAFAVEDWVSMFSLIACRKQGQSCSFTTTTEGQGPLQTVPRANTESHLRRFQFCSHRGCGWNAQAVDPGQKHLTKGNEQPSLPKMNWQHGLHIPTLSKTNLTA